MSKPKIRTTYIGVALIAMLLLFNLINKENTKMGWNPANWQITDVLQGQEKAPWLGGGVSSVGAGTYGSAGDIASKASNTTSPQVLGDNTGMGYLYYDSAQGKFVSSDPENDPTYNPNPTYSRYNADGTPYVDPYSQWGGKSAYDAKVGEINQGKQSVLDSANMSRDAQFNTGRSSILDFIGGARQQQDTIDQKRANAQFSLQEGKGDIMDMVGRGIRSGGVMLANKNAASSGAAGQIARAYGELGNREARDVGNQFALENQGIDLEQNNLATGFETQKRKIDEFKISNTDNIVNSAKADLQALEARRIGASLPELFQIDQLTQQIKDATMAKLGELDSLLQSERAKINPMDNQQVMAKANDMRTAGTGGPQMFNFNTNAANVQTTGAPIAGAELPIYSNLALNRRREA